MKKCSNAKNYKGIRPPKCNKGRGCEACWAIFQNKCEHDPIDWRKHGDNQDAMISCCRCHAFIFSGENPSVALMSIATAITKLTDSMESVQSDIRSIQKDIRPLHFYD